MASNLETFGFEALLRGAVRYAQNANQIVQSNEAIRKSTAAVASTKATIAPIPAGLGGYTRATQAIVAANQQIINSALGAGGAMGGGGAGGGGGGGGIFGSSFAVWRGAFGNFSNLLSGVTGSFGGLSKAAKNLSNVVLKLPSELATAAYFLGRLQFVAISTIAALAALSSPIIFAAQFEESLSRIEGLTETPKEAIAGLREEILALSKETAISPEKLGLGAYRILSSGIKDVTTATNVLELASKASVAGLGEVDSVARVLTSALNAYGLGAGDAAALTNQLVATVKLGSGEASEFANVLGFVIPIAAQIGVEFNQVGAILATLTNQGLSASTAVTALRGVFTQLLNPAESSIEVFNALSEQSDILTGDIFDFRKEVDENAVAALQKLVEAAHGSEAILAELFPDVRGLVGVMAAFGNQGGQTAENLDGVTNSTGDLENAVLAATNTVAFKARKAFNDFKLSLTELGITLLPAASKALEAVSRKVDDLSARLPELFREWRAVLVEIGPATRDVAEFFLDLDDNFREFLDTVSRGNPVLVAAIAPLQWILDNHGLLIAALVAIGIAFIWAHPLGAVAVGLGVIIGSMALFRAELDQMGPSALKARIAVLEFYKSFIDGLVAVEKAVFAAGTGGILGAFDAIFKTDLNEKAFKSVSGLSEVQSALNDELRETNDILAVAESNQSFQKLAESIKAGTGVSIEALSEYSAAYREAIKVGDEETQKRIEALVPSANFAGAYRKITKAIQETNYFVAQGVPLIQALQVAAQRAGIHQRDLAASILAVEGASAATSASVADLIGFFQSVGQAAAAQIVHFRDLAAAQILTIELARNPGQFGPGFSAVGEAVRAANAARDAFDQAFSGGGITPPAAAEVDQYGRDLLAGLEDSTKDQQDKLDAIAKALGLRFIRQVIEGVRDGSINLGTALDAINRGFFEAGKFIVEMLADRKSQVQSQLDILTGVIGKNQIELADVNKLFQAGLESEAVEFLRAMASRGFQEGKVITEQVLAGIRQGILENRTRLTDALGLLEQGFDDAAEAIVSGFADRRRRIQTELDTLLDVFENQTISAEQIQQLFEIGADDAAADLLRALQDNRFPEAMAEVGEDAMRELRDAILDGTLDVFDALHFLEAGMIDIAQSLIERMTDQVSKSIEQWQVLVDILTRGAITIADVQRLIEIGATEAAINLLREFQEGIGPVTDAIFRHALQILGPRFPDAESFQHGGFVEAGKTQPALLHGPEIVVPLGNQAAMMRILGQLGAGMGGSSSFRNYGSIHLNERDSGDSLIVRSFLRALS